MSTRTFIDIHIPKTGGTTLYKIFKRKYLFAPVFNMRSAPSKSIPLLKQQSQAQRNGYVGITGHMHFGIHEVLTKDFFYTTMIRKPYPRVISLYKQVLHNHGLSSKDKSLKSFYEEKKNLEFDNDQVRRLGGYWGQPGFGEIGEAHLQKAKENVDKYFKLVGLQERFDETLALYGIVLGWKFPPLYRSFNVAAHNKAKNTADIDEQTAALIKQYNQYDEQLYDYCAQKFEVLLAKNENEVKKTLNLIALLNPLFSTVYVPYLKIRRMFSQG